MRRRAHRRSAETVAVEEGADAGWRSTARLAALHSCDHLKRSRGRSVISGALTARRAKGVTEIRLIAVAKPPGNLKRAASRFAAEAQNASVSNDVRPALAALGTDMRQCVACHAAYRLH